LRNFLGWGSCRRVFADRRVPIQSLLKLDESRLSAEVSGVIRTVHKRQFFVGVIAEREYQAVKAESFFKEINSELDRKPFIPDQK